jgi:hypothetical protein
MARRAKLAGIVAGVALCVCSWGALASEIDVSAADANVGLCCVGEYHPGHISSYWAQTFNALTGYPTSLTVYLLDNVTPSAPGPFDYHLLVTDLSASGSGFHPQNALWESGPLFASLIDYVPVTVNLSGLNLNSGDEYAWIIDTAIMDDGINDVGQSLAYTTNPYPEGSFYAQFETGGGRAADFAAPWFGDASIDLAFVMKFSNTPALVPEPSSLRVFISALGLLFGHRVFRKGGVL